MDTWHGYTPDGRELAVRREHHGWTVLCGTNNAHNKLLDLALIEAVRAESNIVPTHEVDYGPWIRAQADRIEHQFGYAP